MAVEKQILIPLAEMAVRCGVPDAWLRREAEAKRIPSLRVGRRLLFNVEAVERALLARAAEVEAGHAS
jgi:excisionase family DNA binding protein